MRIVVRAVEAGDAAAWRAMRVALWPGDLEEHDKEIAAHLRGRPDHVQCFVAERGDDALVGFVEVGLRAYAEGCSTSPVGYLEGIWVVPEARRAGVGQALAEAAEAWARAQGCTEMGSDRLLANDASGLFHAAVGYAEVERIVCFMKKLV